MMRRSSSSLTLTLWISALLVRGAFTLNSGNTTTVDINNESDALAEGDLSISIPAINRNLNADSHASIRWGILFGCITVGAVLLAITTATVASWSEKQLRPAAEFPCRSNSSRKRILIVLFSIIAYIAIAIVAGVCLGWVQVVVIFLALPIPFFVLNSFAQKYDTTRSISESDESDDECEIALDSTHKPSADWIVAYDPKLKANVFRNPWTGQAAQSVEETQTIDAINKAQPPGADASAI